MRQRIKEIATELLIRLGYRGFLFKDVAAALDITRANIHYHFGSKTRLVEEVIDDYMKETVTAHERIWMAKGRSLARKLSDLADFNRGRYRKYSSNASDRTFSLIARMRHDRDMLTPAARKGVMAFGDQIESWVRHAVSDAVENAELRPDAPTEDIVAVIFTLTNSAASITEDAGSFARWESAYRAAARLVEEAYGATPADSSATLRRSAQARAGTARG